MKLRLIVFVGFAAFGSACGKMSMTLGDSADDSSEAPVKLSNGAEFIAGAQKGEVTPNRYVVDSSTGSTFSRLTATTASGYRIYSTVEGQLASELVQADEAKSAANR